ncbi:hypothetical protein [Arachidicoccus ginsenosidimutans]|uniref:hypothetical protein n=1 Tax=Arachidicoccus sp. BS20 TaxID=1850526 RepID=UPI0012E95E01|nr:hypothetical protein [Arachidicoccus sp. BS20]
MSQFYCIYNSQTTDSLNVAARLASLEKACQKYNIQFCLMDEAITDFSNLPVPTEHDGLYNCTRGSLPPWFVRTRTTHSGNVNTRTGAETA